MPKTISLLGKLIAIIVEDAFVRTIQSGTIIGINTNHNEVIIETTKFNDNYGVSSNTELIDKIQNCDHKREGLTITSDYLYWGTTISNIYESIDNQTCVIF